jgi:hypothetical protein
VLLLWDILFIYIILLNITKISENELDYKIITSYHDYTEKLGNNDIILYRNLYFTKKSIDIKITIYDRLSNINKMMNKIE